VTHHDALLAKFLDVGSQTQAQSLDAKQVDLGAEQPAGVVFPEARGLDQGIVLEVRRLYGQFGAGAESMDTP